MSQSEITEFFNAAVPRNNDQSDGASTSSSHSPSKHAEFKGALKKQIISVATIPRFYAYVVLFFPEFVLTVELAWKFLENADKETRVLHFYAGRATVNCVEFSVEKFHLDRDKRTQSTVFDFIRETRCRAFQLCALEFDTFEESILQLYGWSSKSTKSLRPNTINYTLINIQPDGQNWLKLLDEDFSLAVDEGKARKPLVCPDLHCSVSHKVRGKNFGQLNKNEVKLIPFDYHV